VFNPFDERGDGLATIRWLREQPWHSQRIGMIGPSYLGIVQWAVAPEAGDDLRALAIQVSASQFHGQTYAGGSLSLQTSASWLVLVAAQERRLAPLMMAVGLRRLPALLAQSPLSDLDQWVTGAEVAWFREALANQRREDAYWVARDYAAGVETVRTPVQLIGGWWDIFLPWMLEDFSALRAAGRNTQLIIGPWTHTAPGVTAAGVRDGLAWLRAELLDDRRLVAPASVRVYVTGERIGDRWRTLEGWPPPGSGERRLWLGEGGTLQHRPPETASGSGDRYRFDPDEPTPSVGGPTLLESRPVLDNRELEQRADVLTYTSEPLADPHEAIGPVRVELHVRTSSSHFDLFARVCDVDPAGASWNVCDALTRVDPDRLEPAADGSWRVAFDLWPTAHRFAARHRIRLQVSSGAHPRYLRNPGTGEDPISATTTVAVEIEVLRDPDHPSLLVLPAAAAS
jgi:hypothetical protein